MKAFLHVLATDINISPLFQSTFPQLYNDLALQDASQWSQFARSSQCEQDFPGALQRKLTPFQQLLVVQATRLDRLQSAMGQFACRALSMKELSPPNVNLKRLFETETTASEPILIIISPGADPSQELEELAQETIGHDRYHQVGRTTHQCCVKV